MKPTVGGDADGETLEDRPALQAHAYLTDPFESHCVCSMNPLGYSTNPWESHADETKLEDSPALQAHGALVMKTVGEAVLAHSGIELRANLESISHRFHLFEVAFV